MKDFFANQPDDSMLTTISLIGGSGFIGTRLFRRFNSNKELLPIIIDKVSSKKFPDSAIIGDVRSIEQLRNTVQNGSVIVNLAAEHRDDVRPPSLYDDVNVEGAKNICAVAKEKNVKKIIFTSSVAVYGFAPIGTDESGEINPFNDYGRTKYEAEQIFKAWQAEAATERSLVIIRPTVVFGEQNRGNVYNLLKQIASGKFVMVGTGENRKSMAYVENLAAFIEYSIKFHAGVHIYNFIDKPDLTMNQLVKMVKRILGQSEKIGLRLPYTLGYMVGKGCDFMAALTGRQLTISSMRVKKFCTNSIYGSSIGNTGFVPPVPFVDALERTVRHEFIEEHNDEPLYFSE